MNICTRFNSITSHECYYCISKDNYFVLANNLSPMQKKPFITFENSENLEKYEINVFQPMPAPIDKIQNKIRWRIIAKGVVNEEVTIILNKCLQNVYGMKLRHTKVSVDVNPNNMM